MKSEQASQIGGVFFFLGVTLLLLSWYFSYPVGIGALDELTFVQFSWFMWPGILFSLAGLFVAGYFSTRNSVKAVCASIFPLIIYSYAFYFSSTSSSDIGNVTSMFEVFHITGIDSSVVSYFQYPTYFTLNEITRDITGLNANGIAMIFFGLYGILLGLFLYLFLFRVTRKGGNQIANQIALLGVFIYFSISFSFLNYQWVPQTLALVFFFILLTTYNHEEKGYRLLTLIVFIALIFTHIFIPVLFLLFFGLYSLKNRKSFRMFIIMSCFYVSVLVFFATYYLPQIISAFEETIYGFGEYSATLAESFKETSNFFEQVMSFINRVRVPVTLVFVSVGFLIGMIKKQIHYTLILLGLVGGFYLVLGLAYPVLGWRALQVLIISLVVGLGFFLLKMKKPTTIVVFILIILSIFGTMRYSYDQTQFITNGEENASHFLVSSMSYEKTSYIGVDQVDWGYITNLEMYVNRGHSLKARPSSMLFYTIFNLSMKENNFVLYNNNLGKEIRNDGFLPHYAADISRITFANNKVYCCGNTYILTG